MTTSPIVIEALARVAPLGVRFWDAVTRAAIGDDLIVTAYRATQPDRRVALTLNHSNTFVLQNVLRDQEFGAGDDDYWDALPPAHSWIIEVRDGADRFVPFLFEAAVPQRGPYQFACGSPLEFDGLVPLFSSAARALAGMGIIRADLCDALQFDPRTQKYAPAPYAALEAWYKSKLIGRGLADKEGRIVVPFPYPEPINPPFTSPPGPRKALTAQSWTIELRAYYAPFLSPLTGESFPDLCAALRQLPATLLSALSPPTPLTQIEVAYGSAAIVKTVDRSELLIAP